MKGDSRKKFEKKFEKKIVSKIPWDRLSEEEKEEIKKKAEIKRKELERKENQKTSDIMLGKQKTQDNAWE